MNVKNPVLPLLALPHEVSSKEKAILAIHPLPLGWPPALPGGTARRSAASWLFHVILKSSAKVLDERENAHALE